MRVIFVEDETAAAVNLKTLLGQVCPDAQVLAVLESVTDTVKWFLENPVPDLVFMDIHLADGDAFRIFEQAEVACPVVFTTAYDQYALDAFRVTSIDYLLKPIKREDLARALAKLSLFSKNDRSEYSVRVEQMARQQNERQRTFLIHIKDKIIPLGIQEIAFCYTCDERVTVYTLDGRELPMEGSLDSLMGSLPETLFFRANRQFIISRKAIVDIFVWFGNRLSLNLALKTPERIVISKARVPEFKRWMTGTPRK